MWLPNREKHHKGDHHMELKFNPTNRKALAKAAAEILGTQAKYQGVATMAYQIGELTLRRDGALAGEIPFGLLTALAERGFEPEPNSTFHLITPRGTLLCQKRYNTREEAEADGYTEYFHHKGRDVYIKQNPDGATEHSKLFAVVGAPFEKPAPEPTNDGVCIEYPRAGMSDEAIENLRRMVAAKAPLLKKALQIDDLPIEVLDDGLAFDWFSAENDNGQIDCWAQFIAALCNTAKSKKRVTAKAPEGGFENEAFAMRVWLVGLGLIGPEHRLVRALLGKGLSGSSAWRYGPPKKGAAAEEAEVQGDE
jgi:hypothetical protein